MLRLVEERGNFYVIDSADPTSLKMHASYHASGQRHFKVEGRIEWPENYTPHWADGFPTDVDLTKPPPKHRYISQSQPTSTLRGVELILGTTTLPWLFQNLPLYDRSSQPALLLDTDAAQFRDEIFFMRVFLIEPELEPDIPSAVNVGPKLIHVIKTTNPWVGIAFFQQKAP